MTNSFYDVLGVPQQASDAEIKKAYRQLSLTHHPDRNPTEDTTTTFQNIGEAYETLSDPQRRADYDRELRFGCSREEMFHNFDDMPNEFMNMVFGGGGIGSFGMGPGIRIVHSNGGGGLEALFHAMHHVNAAAFHSMPEPIQTTLSISLEQAYHGCVCPLEIERWVLENQIRIHETETLYVTIPQGIDHNEQIIIKEKGNVIRNQFSDVKITIHLENNTCFKRSGMDLIFHKSLTLKESLCGCSFEMQHINGKTMTIQNKTNHTILKPNYTKVVPKLGMVRENQIGNMMIVFDVVFPDSLTREQIDTLETIL